MCSSWDSDFIVNFCLWIQSTFVIISRVQSPQVIILCFWSSFQLILWYETFVQAYYMSNLVLTNPVCKLYIILVIIFYLKHINDICNCV